MKTVSKKLLSLLLVAFLLVSALPFQAFATGEGIDDTPIISDATPEEDIMPLDEGGAVVHDPDLHKDFVPVWNPGTRTHSFKCTAPGCTYVQPGAEACEFNSGSHECKDCHHQYEEHDYEVVTPAKDPTCTENGSTAVKVCTMCGDRIGGDMLPSLGGHNFGADGKCQNTGCEETKAATYSVTLYAGEGHAFENGYTTRGFSLTVGQDIPISNLSAPVDPKGEFVGWYIKGTDIPLDTTKPYDGTWTELEARWKTTTYEVTFYRILNNQLSTASLITKVNLTPDTNLAKYVTDSGLLTNEKITHPGYRLVINSQDYPVKKYVNGVFSPLGNTDVAESLRTVYINLTPEIFTLSLNANGGSVNPAVINNIAYGTTVTLPTPTKLKSVFQGWKDTDGNIYKGSMVYQFTSNATLTAVWDDEVSVMLRIFINGDFSAPDRIVELTGYIAGSKVIRLTSDGSGTPDVTSIIQKYYVSSNGSALNVRGLFKEADWESFKANPNLAGDPIVTVDKSTIINVMVYNAKNGQTIVNNPGSGSGSNLPVNVPNNGNAYWVITGKGTGYWVYTNGSTSALPQGAYWGGSYYIYDPNNIGNNNPTYPVYPTYPSYPNNSNPKTGDTAKIEIAAAVMVLAAAALVTVMVLRKKKSV